MGTQIASPFLQAPIPGIVQQYHKELKADWDIIVNQIASLSQQEDQCCLQMGDLLGQIKGEWGNTHVKQAAAEAGISMSVARQRLWVSAKIPLGHFLRTTHLTYGHLRAIAGTNDIDRWGNESLQHGWTINQLKEAIEAESDQLAVADGEPCVFCAKPLSEDKKTVSFTIKGEKRHRACSYICAAEYFVKRNTEADSEEFSL